MAQTQKGNALLALSCYAVLSRVFHNKRARRCTLPGWCGRRKAGIDRLAGKGTGKVERWRTRIGQGHRIVRSASLIVGWRKRCGGKAGDSNEQGEEPNNGLHLW